MSTLLQAGPGHGASVSVGPAIGTFAGRTPEAWDPEAYLDALPAVLRQSVEAFLYGLCFPMAMALHHRTGYPMAILFDEWDGSSVHAFVIATDGRWMDAAGWCDMRDFEERYEFDEPVVCAADLSMMERWSAVLNETSIGAAGHLLDRLPGHPWRGATAGGAVSSIP